jgi:hypothetical protein
MGIREDMETLKFLQQQAATRQGDQSQMSPMMGFGQSAQMPAEEMQAMQGMQQPQIPQQRNPLEAGSRSAVEAAKRSLEMNENENSRALGRALMGMMSGIGQSESYGNGFAGNLGAINAGFAPALSAYDAERDRVMQMNHALAVQQKQEAMLARQEEHKMKKMAHEMDMAQKNLKLNEGYLGLERQKIERERALEEEMTKAGAEIPLGRLSNHPSMYNKAMDDIKHHLEKREAAIPALQAIDTVERVLKVDPNVTKHWGTIVLAAQRNDPGIIRQQLGNRLPEQTRIHAEMLAKSLAVLPAAKFKSMPARGLTVFAEKLIKEGSPSIDMHAKSILSMVKPDKKFYEHTIQSGDEVYEKLQKGIRYIPKPMELDLEKFEDVLGEDNPYIGLSDSELAAKEAEIKRQLGGS